jgi:uncharacterized repeat protein (TIGR03803 family)
MAREGFDQIDFAYDIEMGKRIVSGIAMLALCVPAMAQTITNLVSLNGTKGNGPHGPLVQGFDGNFYGTALLGGTHSWGVVFKMTPAGALSVVYNFMGAADGGEPQAGLVQGTDGNFYGTTLIGGCAGCGTVFKITPGGALTTLHTFVGNPDGGRPVGGLTQGLDGNFYGTTLLGGSNSNGTFYQVTPSGTLTILHSFTGSTDGAQPSSSIVQAADGNFYGTTNAGTTNGNGTIFKFTQAGMFSTVYTFPAYGGPQSSVAGLVQGADGNLYGTTSGGGNGFGTAFKFAFDGMLTTIYSFHGNTSDGSQPVPGMMVGSDGNFYGTTSTTLFQLTPGGAERTLFNYTSNANSTTIGMTTAGLIQATDGDFYGTCVNGGDNELGCVFRLQVSGVTPAFFAGEAFLGNGTYYLSFPNGTLFGYYGFLTGSPITPNAWVYHVDLGYEYLLEGTPPGSIYVWDFSSQHWWYTSASLFPYLYDFTLNSFIYYFPDTKTPGHYTANPRYFSNLTTGKIFTM